MQIELSEKDVQVLILALALAITDEHVGGEERARMKELAVRIGTASKEEDHVDQRADGDG